MDIHHREQARIFGSLKKPVYVCHGQYEFLQKELAKKIIDFLMPRDDQQIGLLRIDGSGSEAIYDMINASVPEETPMACSVVQ